MFSAPALSKELEDTFTTRSRRNSKTPEINTFCIPLPSIKLNSFFQQAVALLTTESYRFSQQFDMTSAHMPNLQRLHRGRSSHITQANLLFASTPDTPVT